MSTQKTDPDALWFMLGEIRGDLKFLVEERKSSNRRMDEMEASSAEQLGAHAKRLSALEAFRIKIGVLATALGVFVPTTITVLARKMGLL